jgi:hexosaminidase
MNTSRKNHLTELAFAVLFAILFAAPLLAADNRRLPLVPYPQTVTLRKSDFVPPKNLVLKFADGDTKIKSIAATCVKDLGALKFSASCDKAVDREKVGVIELSIRNDKLLGAEGYRLTIDSKISVSAATAKGLFWGTRTVLQLLQKGPGKPVPQLAITDKPSFPYRGLMVDNARKFHSLEFHIKTIKQMASFKLNRYQIHFSDDQSYTLPSEAFPKLPTKDRCYTKQQVKQLVAAAKEYHVMIVPEIDVPGHARAMLRGIASLKCTDKNKLCIGNEKTYQTLEKLFAEIMEMIPGEYWHLGADEIHYKGTKCVACLKRIKDEKLADGDQLFNYFINRMHGVIKPKGRKMLVWEGFRPTQSPKIDKDVIVCPFDIKHAGIMPRDYFQAGYTVLNTSWTPLYIADRLYMTTPEILARWSPNMFGAGRSPQPYAYWKKFRPGSFKPGQIIGAQMCSWANEEKVEAGLIFGTGPGFENYGRPGPRAQIMAERLWTGSTTTPKDLLERVGQAYWERPGTPRLEPVAPKSPIINPPKS